MRASGLSKRELAFVLAYVIDENGQQAAISAGYSPRTARITGSQLLTRPNVAAAVEAQRRLLRERAMIKHGVTLDWIIAEFHKLAAANSADFVDIDSEGLPRPNFAKVSRDQLAAVASVECEIVGHETVFEVGPDGEKLETSIPIRKVKYKLHDKIAALTNLARLLGAKLPDPSAPAGSTTINLNDNRTLVLNGLSEDELARQYRETLGVSSALPGGTKASGS